MLKLFSHVGLRVRLVVLVMLTVTPLFWLANYNAAHLDPAEAQAFLARNLTILILVTLGAISAGLVGGQFLVLGPLARLVEATRRLSSGELTARTNLGIGREELGQLARAIDEMAERLQAHELERQKLYEALSEQEEHYRALVEQSADAISVVVGRTRVFANNAFLQIYGLEDRSQVEGQPADLQMLPEDSAIAQERALARQRGELLPEMDEYRIRRPDGQIRVLERSRARVTYKGEPAYLTVARDVTDRRRVEEDLRRSHEELKATQAQVLHLEKMETVGRLAAGVAHEVKNPLATLLMGVEYLSQSVEGEDGNTAAMLEDMREAVRQADRVVRDLLDVAAPPQPEVMIAEDLNQVVDECLHLFRHDLLRHGIAVVTELDDQLPRVLLDRDRIRQALANLVSNAIDAMQDGGLLTVGTRVYRARLDQFPVVEGKRSRPPFRPGERVVVAEVKDTGSGIPEQHLRKIFDPFFTTKAPGAGTGLGLAVTRTIMEAHGGAIIVRNREGRGTSASLVFPSQRGK